MQPGALAVKVSLMENINKKKVILAVFFSLLLLFLLFSTTSIYPLTLLPLPTLLSPFLLRNVHIHSTLRKTEEAFRLHIIRFTWSSWRPPHWCRGIAVLHTGGWDYHRLAFDTNRTPCCHHHYDCMWTSLTRCQSLHQQSHFLSVHNEKEKKIKHLRVIAFPGNWSLHYIDALGDVLLWETQPTATTVDGSRNQFSSK